MPTRIPAMALLYMAVKGKEAAMFSAGMFKQVTEYIKSISIRIYKGIKDILGDSMLGVMELLSFMGVRTVSVNASNVFGGISRGSGDVSRGFGGISRSSGDVSRVSGDVSRVSGDVSHVSGDVSHVSGDVSRGSGDVSRGSGDTSRGSGDTSTILVNVRETLTDTRNCQEGYMPLYFCVSFKMFITNIKIYLNQCVTKTNCLWERIKINNNRNDHFIWYFGLSENRKLKQLINILIIYKNILIYV